MKYIPILFSTPMVQAEQDGRKTETRRTRGLENINPAATEIVPSNQWPLQGDFVARFKIGVNPTQYEVTDIIKCPYGQTGDVLWVRETFLWDWKDYPERTEKYYVYKADIENYPMSSGENWKPSIHMPKTACRTFLQVQDIQVQRLQDITEQDAINEGVENTRHSRTGSIIYKCYDGSCDFEYSAKESFQTLWQSINGPTSWQANPWVWVIKFKRIPKPENFC